ncbi:MAG TPA: glycoside hydrolase family 57 protein [Prolixibacteraceae bacterium]|nr:glycoside hydrolase family 57 protein [Prolixibacteraceae bacterium]
MKSLCLLFQVHHPFRFRRYRFFDIGNDHYYYDDYANETEVRNLADRCYLPANKLLLKLIGKTGGKFRVAFSISGVALEQFELYAPEVIDSFRELAQTGSVEFLAETWAHSLAALYNPAVFQEQVKRHQLKVEELFGQKPVVFRNTEMIYSDEIGQMVADLGFRGMVTEGPKHILGWKSPNFLYCNPINPRLKVLMRNFRLSDDLTFHFSNPEWSEYPLTPEKYVDWIATGDPREEVVNIFLEYATFGEYQKKESGIFTFLEKLPAQVFKTPGLNFATPGEVTERLQPVSAVTVPHPISWSDEERDLSLWQGNELQNEAVAKLYESASRMSRCNNPELLKDWNYLQASDHFHCMSTKFFNSGAHPRQNYYSSPYEAFINYMNVLSDFRLRLNAQVPESPMEEELSVLNRRIEEKEKRIRQMEEEIARLQKSGKTWKSLD